MTHRRGIGPGAASRISIYDEAGILHVRLRKNTANTLSLLLSKCKKPASFRPMMHVNACQKK